MRAQNKAQSQKSEERVEAVTGLERTPGSGCGLLFKGDNGNKDWHFEDKSTRQERLVVKREWWEKTRYQAQQRNKTYYALGLSWKYGRFVLVPNTYAIGLHSLGTTVSCKQSFGFAKDHPLVTMTNNEYWAVVLGWTTVLMADGLSKLVVWQDLRIITELAFKELVERHAAKHT